MRKMAQTLANTAIASIALANFGSEVARAQVAESPTNRVDTAQATPSAETGDIVVTARRRNENLRDVPASVTVISSDALAAARVRSGKDFTQLTSGVSIITGAINAGDVQVNIRGINGARDAPGNVAVVVDGIQKSSTAAIVQSQGVLESVEVLKGPQGALYGRNSIAGAFVIKTKKPGDHLEGLMNASAGNNNTYRVSALLSGPVSPYVGFVLSGDWSKTDGFYRNTFLPSAQNAALYPGNSRDGSSVDSKQDWNVNGRIVWAPNPGTELDLKAHYGKYRGDAINFNAVFQLPGLASVTGNPLFNEDINKHDFVYTSNNDPINRHSNLELSLRGSQDLGFASLAGWIAYNDFKNNQSSDNPSGTAFGYFNAEPHCAATTAALQGFPVAAPFGIGGGALLPPYSPTTCDGVLYEQHDQRDYSGEIRLIGKPGSQLQWQIGAYYLNIDRRDCLATQLDVGASVYAGKCYSTDPRTRTEGLQDDNGKADVYAGFGSLDYAVADGLKLGAALRYDVEKRRTISLVPADARTLWVGNVLTGHPNGTPTAPANYYLNPGLDPAYNPSGRLDPRSATYTQLQPKINIAYKVSPVFSVFANWGIGFKSGGFNPAGTTAIVNGYFNATVNAGVAVQDSFKKETSSAFEVGLKGKTANNVLNYELSAYYTDSKNAQVFEFFVGSFGVLRVVENIDKVRIFGLEGSLNYRIMRGWTLFGSANWTDSKIRKNATRPYTVGNRSPDTADFTINLGTQFSAPLGSDLRLSGRADARITGPTYFSAVQNNSVPNIFPFGNGNFSNARRSTYTVVNGQVGLEYKSFSVNAFVSNLFDKRYIGEAIVTPEFGGAFGSPGDRRAYGIEIGAKF